MTWQSDDHDPAAVYRRAKRKLRRAIFCLGLAFVLVLVTRHYVVDHLEQTAKVLAAAEEEARAASNVTVK